MQEQRFCSECKEYNCLKHNSNSKTSKFNELLEYFQEPEEDMRTFIGPEKRQKQGIEKALHPLLDDREGDHDNYDRHDPKMQSVYTTDRLVDPRLTRIRRDRNSSVNQETNSNLTNGEVIQPTPIVSAPESRAMVRIATEDVDEFKSEFDRAKSESSCSSSGVPSLTGGRYKPHERHHFAKINGTSFVSCSSPDGLYSEIAIFLWMDNKQFAKTSFSTDRYKVVISLMYDAEDDLWSVSSKLIKRVSYLSKEEEEGQIQNRLCITSELRAEIKKMLLFMSISPREVYRLFRRSLEEECGFTETEYGFTTLECNSHSKFIKEFEKATTSTSSHPGYGGWDYHRHYQDSSHVHSGHVNNHANRSIDTEQWKEAMMYAGCGDSWE